ncbi:hypothetical protein HYY74_05875 [Candidatus Woesearchaeota archaeon]|nr:hypothetical protein [Candidatus Woesearchaeota archaeon]
MISLKVKDISVKALKIAIVTIIEVRKDVAACLIIHITLRILKTMIAKVTIIKPTHKGSIQCLFLSTKANSAMCSIVRRGINISLPE